MTRHRFPPSRRILTIGQQVSRMREDFPQLVYRREDNVPTWRGPLQPTPTSSVYEIRMVYNSAGKYREPPSVWVESPRIQPSAPHLYRNGALCLHFPEDRSWNPRNDISKTIVLWAALWLAFYEVWLSTGQWYGPEAPHMPK